MAEAVKSIELLTSAEVVVTVRRRSGDYRPAAYHFGFFVSGLVVAYLLLIPDIVSVGAMALDAVLGFGLGLVVAFNVSPLLRVLARAPVLEARVAEAARVAFFDLGITRTSGRSGVLIFVSTFEKRCAVLCDIGIDQAALGAEWGELRTSLSRAVAARDLKAFQRSVRAMGPILGAQLPRRQKDVNELPDEVR